MFLDTVGTLRCPHEHEQSWLVLGTARMAGRDVLEGVLGCPVCNARFPVMQGTADLRLHPGPRPFAAATAPSVNSEEVLRLAALLGLTDAGGSVLLMGGQARYAVLLAAIAEVRFVLVNAPPDVPVENGQCAVLADERFPLASGGIRAAALDANTSDTLRDDVVRVLKIKGRLAGPASMAMPAGVGELARDATGWVAERTLTQEFLASLGRRGR